MVSIPIPAGPEQLDAEWLTSALQSRDVLVAPVAVSGFDSTVLGEGKGFTGRVLRLDVRYDDETDSPASIIAKFPPASPEAREALHYYRLYEKEIAFYRDLASSVFFRVPDSYYGDVNLETGEFVLLLEDLAPAIPFDIVEGVAPDEARHVVRDMARHHAQWWESAKLDRFEWLRPFDDQAEGDQEKYQAAYPVFLDKVGDLLPDGIAALGARLLDKSAWIKTRIAASPVTFLHGDFHPNNLFLEGKGDERRLAVVDWQVCSVGQGTRDLMYFVTTALIPEHREAHETEFLELYHSELVANGVGDFSLSDVVEGYRFALLDLLQFFTIVIFLLDFEVNDEARAVRDLIIARWGGAIAAHDPGELLPQDQGSDS